MPAGRAAGRGGQSGSSKQVNEVQGCLGRKPQTLIVKHVDKTSGVLG